VKTSKQSPSPLIDIFSENLVCLGKLLPEPGGAGHHRRRRQSNGANAARHQRDRTTAQAQARARRGKHTSNLLELLILDRSERSLLLQVDTLAYQYTQPAPNFTTPESNVIVRLCDISSNMGAPLTDPSNELFATIINQWFAITERIYIWNYVSQRFSVPLPVRCILRLYL
jgi:hypothetical protein